VSATGQVGTKASEAVSALLGVSGLPQWTSDRATRQLHRSNAAEKGNTALFP